MRIRYKVVTPDGRVKEGYSEPHIADCLEWLGGEPYLREVYVDAGWELASWEDVTQAPQTLQEAVAKVRDSKVRQELGAELGLDKASEAVANGSVTGGINAEEDG